VNYITHTGTDGFTGEFIDHNHDHHHEISHNISNIHYEDGTKSPNIMIEKDDNEDLIPSTTKMEETKYDNNVVGEGVWYEVLNLTLGSEAAVSTVIFWMLKVILKLQFN